MNEYYVYGAAPGDRITVQASIYNIVDGRLYFYVQGTPVAIFNKWDYVSKASEVKPAADGDGERVKLVTKDSICHYDTVASKGVTCVRRFCGWTSGRIIDLEVPYSCRTYEYRGEREACTGVRIFREQ